MRLTFLGTGTSVGVPYIGCKCEVCTSSDPRDRRLRCSAMIETHKTRIIIDVGPDFRQQMLAQEFRHIDGVLLTHIHYDHVGGMDDIRPFCKFGEVNIYADEATTKGLAVSMPYCFGSHHYPGSPVISLHTVRPHEKIMINEIEVTPLRVYHGKLPILGYRIGDKLVYITDMKTMSDREWKYIEGVETLVVNALRFTSHPTHQTVDEAVAFARKAGARRTYLIHACHDIGLHEDTQRRLPEGVSLAYDGLVIDV